MVSLAQLRDRQRKEGPQDIVAQCRSLVAAGGARGLEAAALLGMSLIQQGQQEEGRHFLAEATRQRELLDGLALADLGGGLLLLGFAAQAVTNLEEAAAQAPDDGYIHNRLGLALALLGRFEQAIEAFENALALLPGNPGFRVNLARVMVRVERWQKALDYLGQVDDLPGDSGSLAWEIRLEALVGSGRLDEAETLYRSAAVPGSGSTQFDRLAAMIAAGRDRHDEAEFHYRQALAKNPTNVRALEGFSILSEARGRFFEAIPLLQKAVELEPESATLWVQLATVFLRSKAVFQAEKAVQKALFLTSEREGPQHVTALCTLAGVEEEKGNVQAAEEEYRHALAIDPENTLALNKLGHLLVQLGRIEEGITLFEKISKKTPTIGQTFLIRARHYPDDPVQLEMLEQAAARPGLGGSVAAGIYFELARAWEHRGDYDRAFSCAHQANKVRRAWLTYDSMEIQRETERIMATFTRSLFEQRQGGGDPSRLPVFVLGMPRSGTTLVEQILASHPRLFGAGELGQITTWAQGLTVMGRHLGTGPPYPECMATLSSVQIAKMARYCLTELQKFDPDADFVINKLPHNFRHIGLIQLLFPNAAIIHCMREPRDVAISSYFLDFAAKSHGLGYAFDLREFGFHYLDYQHLMDHWHEVLPGKILDVRYEELVEEPEVQVRRMLDYLGLEWDPSVLEFQKLERSVKTASVWQVRQPIYKTSRQRWRNYAKFLGPLEDVLSGRDDHATSPPEQPA
ncbi:MAG: sulfotransferase [Magnetococcales bacterium]|nr:sulfotransferase [Magnetococcales bacterium]